MYPSLHAAIRFIPVSRAAPKDRLNEQLIYFMAAATTILSEAALHDLPVGTRAEVGAVWMRVRARLEGTSPKIVNAVHHYLGLVKAAPFGTDVLGIYWGAFGFEGMKFPQRTHLTPKSNHSFDVLRRVASIFWPASE